MDTTKTRENFENYLLNLAFLEDTDEITADIIRKAKRKELKKQVKAKRKTQQPKDKYTILEKYLFDTLYNRAINLKLRGF